MYYKKENQVANIPGDNGWIITVDTAFEDEKKYTIERVEPFQPEGWTETDVDHYSLVYNAMVLVFENANYQ
jgi:hypothetical protein